MHHRKHEPDAGTASLGNSHLYLSHSFSKLAKLAKCATSRNGGQKHVQGEPLLARHLQASFGTLKRAGRIAAQKMDNGRHVMGKCDAIGLREILCEREGFGNAS